MPPTFLRICLFLSHSADENAAQDEQRFSFGGFAQGHIEEFDSNSIRCEGLVLGVAVVHAITIDLSLCCWTCSNNAMSFASQAFSIRDERVISAGLACEWYIVLAMDETKSKHKEGQAPGTASESNNPSQPKGVLARIKAPLNAAFPVMIGYVFLGIPCGILAQQIGLDPLQVFLLSMLFYSGAGQYMIPNMWLAGSPALAIIASVTLVNTRQLLYGASLSRFCHETPKPLSFLFGATVTDESFAVNLGRFSSEEWKVSQATAVNLLCETTWALANTLGVVLGSLLTVPTALASFAMTSIFLCLLFSQKATKPNIVAALIAVLGVFVCKCVGLSGPAILVGALAGVAAGMIVSRRGGAHVVE